MPVDAHIYVNTCRASHLEMSLKRFTVATINYIAIFFAAEQTRCDLAVFDPEFRSISLT